MVTKTVRICKKCNGKGEIIYTVNAHYGRLERGVKCKKCKGSGKI